MLASDLHEMVVYSKNMEKVGEVKNFEINIEEMKITHLIITLENKATRNPRKTTINKTKKLRLILNL